MEERRFSAASTVGISSGFSPGGRIPFPSLNSLQYVSAGKGDSGHNMARPLIDRL